MCVCFVISYRYTLELLLPHPYLYNILGKQRASAEDKNGNSTKLRVKSVYISNKQLSTIRGRCRSQRVVSIAIKTAIATEEEFHSIPIRISEDLISNPALKRIGLTWCRVSLVNSILFRI